MSDVAQEQSTPVEPERPEWLPENFKEPADLARSYNELQQKLREQGTEKNQAIETVAELQARLAQLEQNQQQQAWQAHQQNLVEEWEMADPAEQLRISAAIAQAAAEQKFAELQAQNAPKSAAALSPDDIVFLSRREMEARYPDWEQYAPRIGEIVQQDPALLPIATGDGIQTVTRRLDSLYKLAKAQEAFETGDTIRSDLAQAAAHAKQQASTISGSNGQQTEASDDAAYWEAVKNADPGGYR